MKIDNIFNLDPYSIKSKEKEKIFIEVLNDLHIHHKKNSPEYKSIIKKIYTNKGTSSYLNSFPFLPVRLFKEIELKSIKNDEIFRVLNSSGTGGTPSKIYLDKNNSKNQIKALTKIASSFLGTKRMPMLIIDKNNISSSKNTLSAREAGVSGFSIFGSTIKYALNDDMTLNYDSINNFIENYKNQKVLIYGFTSVIWEYLIERIDKKKLSKLDNTILLHGGGWKKLASKNITNQIFKKKLTEEFGINQIINYYGMVEQTGSIFFECEKGFFHTSNFSDIIIRDKDFNICKKNQRGLIQLISLLPTSYPGNSIITEDIGEFIGEDTCECKRLGKYFIVHGRIEEAETRGCSDAH